VFGSTYYRYIPNERRKKLDDKNESIILIGYHPIGAYELYDPLKQQVVISIDVIIDEATSWSWKIDVVVNVPCILEHRLEKPETGAAKRSMRTRFPSTILVGHDVYDGNMVSTDGELVHLAFLVDTKHITLR